MRGWHYVSDTTAIYYAFSGQPSHVATIAKNLDRALDDAAQHLGRPFESASSWADADVYCDSQYMPPWRTARVCKVT